VAREDDDAPYRDLPAEHCAEAQIEIWDWVLMPNPYDMVLSPSERLAHFVMSARRLFRR
jgi:REP element-mobilizing transposase RayT